MPRVWMGASPRGVRERERETMEVDDDNNNRRKKKFEEDGWVEKKMLIFMNAGAILCSDGSFSPDGIMCAGIFEIEIVMSKSKNGIKPIIEPVSEKVIKLIGTFFEQKQSGPVIASVGACVIGDGSELYMIPDERDVSSISRRILPCKFNLLDKKTIYDFPPPLAKNITPLVVGIRDQVYALSCQVKKKTLPEPCFELLKDDQWSPLPCSPLFHREEEKGFYQLSGHAVLNDTFILVSIQRQLQQVFLLYSYNIQTGNWKTVGVESYHPPLFGEAVVVDNDIYTFHTSPPGLLTVCSYTDVTKMDAEYDLFFTSVRIVKGLELDKDYLKGYVPWAKDGCLGSGVLAKVEDRILCVLNTLSLDKNRGVLHVCVSFFQIEYEGDRCTTLKSFRCQLEVGNQLSSPTLKSCIVLGPNGTSDSRPSKRAALEDDNQMDF